jgi:hypothetical protein
MKINTKCLKITLLCTAIAFLSGCETGVKNQRASTQVAPSGIVDKHSTYSSSNKISISNAKKIYSNSATPGYYLQVGYFGRFKPNRAYMNKLNRSGFGYTILDKNGNHHALIGAYRSYNQAKSKISSVRSKLSSDAFIVQVLRP